MFSNPAILIIYTIVILLSLTIHEFSHGYIAWRCGDDTAKSSGRLSFNPLSHLDLMGTLVFFISLRFFQMPFGWAKPVPVTPINLTNPKRDMVYVAVAGPLSNMIVAFFCGYSYILLMNYFEVPALVRLFFLLLIRVNLGLAFFNLLPIAPLDGYNIVKGLLPTKYAIKFINIMRYSGNVLFVLIAVEYIFNIRVLSLILTPVARPFFYLWEYVIFGGKVF